MRRFAVRVSASNGLPVLQDYTLACILTYTRPCRRWRIDELVRTETKSRGPHYRGIGRVQRRSIPALAPALVWRKRRHALGFGRGHSSYEPRARGQGKAGVDRRDRDYVALSGHGDHRGQARYRGGAFRPRSFARPAPW